MSGYSYGSCEHAFQASKTFDIEQRMNIRNCKTPAEAKKLGRKVTLRADWEAIKEETMRKLLEQKFFGDITLQEKLIATKDLPLIEGNTWGDKIWGATFNENTREWKGQNLLGKLLMEVRAKLVNKEQKQ